MRFREQIHNAAEGLAKVTAKLLDGFGSDGNYGMMLIYEWPTFDVPTGAYFTKTVTIDNDSIIAGGAGTSEDYVWVDNDVYTYENFSSLLTPTAVLHITSGSGSPYLVELVDVTVKFL